ncbi:MAG: aminotransferase class V-fold PLP-dependent enzyme [Bacillota bacterium]
MSETRATQGARAAPGPYEQMGVSKVINAAATLTRLGGNIIPPSVVEAIVGASRGFVDLNELQLRVGERLAELTHNEGAYVTCGAAAGLYLGVAATLALKDPERFRRVPTDPPLEYEVLIHRAHRNPYDVAVAQFGVRLVEVGQVGPRATEEPVEFLERMHDRTLAILYVISGWLPQGAPPLERLTAAARCAGVVVIVDAAAQLPPVENLWKYTREMGADLAVFSGGKDLAGPADTGLVVGRADLIEAMRRIGYPKHGIGRMLKVSKEAMVGLMVAVERYLRLDHEARRRRAEEVVEYFVRELGAIPGVTVERSFPNEAGQPLPRARVRLQSALAWLTPAGLVEALARGRPSVEVLPAEDGVFLNPMTLQDGEELIVAARIREVLAEAQRTRSVP